MRAKALFEDRQSLLREREGLDRLLLHLPKLCQILQGFGNLRMLRSQKLSAKGDRTYTQHGSCFAPGIEASASRPMLCSKEAYCVYNFLVRGWCGPRVYSKMVRARWYNGSAS